MGLLLYIFPILFFRPIPIVFAFVFEDSRPADGFAIARAADCFQQEGFLSFFLLLFHGNYLSLQPFAVPEASLGTQYENCDQNFTVPSAFSLDYSLAIQAVFSTQLFPL